MILPSIYFREVYTNPFKNEGPISKYVKIITLEGNS